MKKILDIIRNNLIVIKIALIHDVCIIFVSVLFYNIIPLILNYPQNTYDNMFQLELENTLYSYQYFFISIITLLFINIWLFTSLKGIRYLNKESIGKKKLATIRSVCIKLPITAYLVQSMLPSVLIFVVITLSTQNITIVTFKLWVVFFSFGTFVSILSYIFTKRIFTKLLLSNYDVIDNSNSRISLHKRIIVQLLPIFIVAILFTSLIGYSRLISEKGDMIFIAYDNQLSNIEVENGDELINLLGGIRLVDKYDEAFVVTPTNEYLTYNRATIHLSKFFKKHLHEIAIKGDGHVFDYYGVDVQGIAKEVLIDNQRWIIGVKYAVGSVETLIYFVFSFVVLFLINFLVILYFAKTLMEDISRVTYSLEEIALGIDQTLDRKLAITSNDELGDLAKAFNKIQDREKDNIKVIKKNQAILVEQERLASLGQLIGGITHNLKTPIMSVLGGIAALKDLAYEYRDSVGNRSVTDHEHKEMAKEMLTWLEKMNSNCGYMSDVISAVKGQAVQMISTSTAKFTVSEAVKRVELLLRHELERLHCVLNINSRIDANTELQGDVNNLVQVFNNIIINAIHAYDGENGTIEIEIVRSGDAVEFTFKDYGKGIPENIVNRLFKEMITTKGESGTGLGLYMSYAMIKGRFGGNMSIISKEGYGTTVYISIPCTAFK